MYKHYYIRTKVQDFPTLIALGKKLGAIQEYEGEITATHGGQWVYIGELQVCTNPEADPEEFVYEPLRDADGDVLLHANLATPLNLKDVALEKAKEDAAVAAGLHNLGKFFLLDSEGNARAPSNPKVVFL